MSELPSAQQWQTGELDPDSVEYVREELSIVPHLNDCLSDAGDTVSEGGSVTYFRPPLNIAINNTGQTLVSTARNFAEAVSGEGLKDTELERVGFIIRRDTPPEQIPLADLMITPRGIKGNIPPDPSIGYVNLTRSTSGTVVSLGCLDTASHTQYTLPL